MILQSAEKTLGCNSCPHQRAQGLADGSDRSWSYLCGNPGAARRNRKKKHGNNRSRKRVRSRALGLALTPKAFATEASRPELWLPPPGLRLRRSSEGKAASARSVHP